MPNIEFIKLKPAINNVAKSPSPANRANAEWWKNMEKYYHDASGQLIYPHKKAATIRSCPAISDSVNFGYIVYSPVDIYIDAEREDVISWQTPDIDLSILDDQDNSTFINFHNRDQFREHTIPKGFHQTVMKINTLWGIKTDPGYSVWITHPINRNDLPLKVYDAVIDTDVFPLYFPYSFLVKDGFKGVIKAGTPLIQVIPFRREDFSISISEKNKEEIYNNLNQSLSRFTNSYKKLFWKRKNFN